MNINLALLGPIEPDMGNDLIECLLQGFPHSEGEDQITLHISSPGGDVETALNIIGAIRLAKARGIPVHGVAFGVCESSAFWVLMACSSQGAVVGTRFEIHAVTYDMHNVSVADAEKQLDDHDDVLVPVLVGLLPQKNTSLVLDVERVLSGSGPALKFGASTALGFGLLSNVIY